MARYSTPVPVVPLYSGSQRYGYSNKIVPIGIVAAPLNSPSRRSRRSTQGSTGYRHVVVGRTVFLWWMYRVRRHGSEALKPGG